MLPLHTRATITGTPGRPILKVIELTEFLRCRYKPSECALWYDGSDVLQRSRALTDMDWGAIVSPNAISPPLSCARCTVAAPAVPNVIAPGDVIRITERNHLVSILFRRKARTNSLLVTERCNSFCVMCSQPPVEHDDSYRVSELLDVIQLIDPELSVLGLTGGEPTLLGANLVRLLSCLKLELARTRLHVLTNGRRFSDSEFAEQIAAVGHEQVVWAVPLYSDAPEIHDYVVQRRGAFDETLQGLLNLARLNQRIEIRMVLQKATVPRLPQLAHFIARNLTFVDHVAWMGLEPMGFARPNWTDLWLDPADYVGKLKDAVHRLYEMRMATSIYNVPLCALPTELRPFARQSISDWKNSYLPECGGCSLRSDCCGFFSSAERKHLPRSVRPIPSTETSLSITGGAARG